MWYYVSSERAIILNSLMHGIMCDIMCSEHVECAIILNSLMHGIMCDIMWVVNTQLYWIACSRNYVWYYVSSERAIILNSLMHGIMCDIIE